MAERQVGLLERPWQLGLHRALLHRVGARLEHGQDALRADLAAQAVDGGADRGGMVREVVVDAHAAGLALELEPARDVLERRQCRGRRGRRDADVFGGGDRGQRVHLVVLAEQLPLDARDLHRAAQHVERVRLAARAQRAGLFLARAEALHLAPAAAFEHALQRILARVDDQAAARRHGAHQVVELGLDGGEVGEDVRVVELEVVEHRRARVVVDELAALVEERGVVLVGLDDEGRARAAGTVRLAQARRHAEVARHAAHQEARLEAGLLQDPGEHRRRGRLAVRAGDGQHVAALEHVLGQPLRAADVGQAVVEDGLHQRIAARDRVADDEQVGRQRHLVGAVAVDQLDAEGAQLVAHRRVDVGVAAGHLVAGLARERGETAHEGAADAEDMDVHDESFLFGPARPCTFRARLRRISAPRTATRAAPARGIFCDFSRR